MFVINLKCDDCGSVFSDSERLSTCKKCGGLLEIQYDYAAIKNALNFEDIRKRNKNIWRWKELLPLRKEENIITLGEGDTPFLKCSKIEKLLGIKTLYVKNDSLCPTGSFKDRGYSVAISKAVELGVKRALTYTSGNAGASFAAYSARAGIDALILVKKWSSVEKLAMIRSFGHPTVKLDFNTYEEVTSLLEFATKELNIYQFVNFINPYRHEGNKTYAYEIWESLNGKIPDWIIHPTSTGGGLWGSWKGFNELKNMGFIDRLPRIVAVQSEAIPPIVKAFNERLYYAPTYGDPKGTIAQSLGSNAPIGQGKRILKAIYDSHGYAVAIPDTEILEGIRILGMEGIFAEPAGGITISALKKLLKEDVIKPEDSVVCVVTGSGLKQPEVVSMMMGEEMKCIKAEPNQLKETIYEIWK